jgi:hypothetical protein
MELYLTEVEAGGEKRISLADAITKAPGGKINPAGPARRWYGLQVWGSEDRLNAAKKALLTQAEGRFRSLNAEKIAAAEKREAGSGDALVTQYLTDYWQTITTTRPSGRLQGPEGFGGLAPSDLLQNQGLPPAGNYSEDQQ